MSRFMVEFNGVDIGEYLDVLGSFNLTGGADWQPKLTEINGIDGGLFAYTSYGSKEIDMPFTIRENQLEKYAELEKALNVTEPKKLIFASDPNVYYMAIPKDTLSFKQTYRRGGDGVLTWLIPDGVAHSKVVKLFKPVYDENTKTYTFNVENNGSAETPLNYIVKNKNDNGYIGIYSDSGAMEFGDRAEIDGTYAEKSVNLISENGADIPTSATLNAGGLINADEIVQNGTPRIFKADSYWLPRKKIDYAGLGTATSVPKKWVGVSYTFPIPKDAKGMYPKNFSVLAMCIDFYEYTDYGMIQCVVSDVNKNVIAGWSIKKNAQGRNAIAEYEVHGTSADGDISLHNVETHGTGYNENEFNSVEFGKISVVGDKFELNIPTGVMSIERSGVIGTIAEPRYITVFFGAYSGYITQNSNRLGVSYLRFTGHNVTTFDDLPNRYPAGSEIRIDGDECKIYVNGVYTPGDEVRGTEYFKAPIGTSNVYLNLSDFVTEEQEVTAEIRERWI